MSRDNGHEKKTESRDIKRKGRETSWDEWVGVSMKVNVGYQYF